MQALYDMEYLKHFKAEISNLQGLSYSTVVQTVLNLQVYRTEDNLIEKNDRES